MFFYEKPYILYLKNCENLIEEIMKIVDEGHWQYKEYDVYLLEHPKLYGKYEIYRNDVFIQRVLTLAEAKTLINIRTSS